MNSTHFVDEQPDHGDSSVCARVLAAVAEEEGRPPLSFERRLGDVIDPDALQSLFRDECRDGRITFSYLGYRVQVDSDGHVDVTGRDE